jgi:putative addiction module component (TIGR02574 family)
MSPSEMTIFDLSPSQKLQLVEDHWDDLRANAAQVPVCDEDIEEMNRRKARLQAHPASAVNWPSMQQRIRSRYGR